MNKEKLIKWLEFKLLDLQASEFNNIVFEDEWKQIIKFIENCQFD